MCGCESWTIKKAEHWRFDAFELWCWRRLLRVCKDLDCKEIKPVQSKGNQYWVFTGRTDVEADSNTSATRCKELTHWKSLMLGKIEGRRTRGDRGWDGWMASPTQWRWVWINSGIWWWTGRPGVLWFMGSQRVRHNWETELNCLFYRTGIIFIPEFVS